MITNREHATWQDAIATAERELDRAAYILAYMLSINPDLTDQFVGYQRVNLERFNAARTHYENVIGAPPRTTDDVVEILVAEGYARPDVLAAIDSLITAGLELPQSDDGYRITGDELQVLRNQLDTTDAS